MKVKYLPEHTPDYVERGTWKGWVDTITYFIEAQRRWEQQLREQLQPHYQVWIQPQEGVQGIPDYPPNPNVGEAEIIPDVAY